jgi:hypothetical protein
MTSMSTVVGVTGHIHFNESGTQEFRFAVNKLLAELEKKSPKNRPSLACGFAAGADLEVASIAFSRHWSLIAVLAGPRIEVEFEYVDGKTKDLFSDLLSSASEIIVAAPSGTTSPEKYCMVGAKIIELSEDLIAIWDGDTSTPKLGGAAWVVDKFLNTKTQSSAGFHSIVVTR